jgi:hypothetical protein
VRQRVRLDASRANWQSRGVDDLAGVTRPAGALILTRLWARTPFLIQIRAPADASMRVQSQP